MEFLDLTIFEYEKIRITIFSTLIWIIIIIGAKFGQVLISKLIRKNLQKKHAQSQGRIYAVQQVAKYFIYSLATLFALQSIGLNLNILLTGSAALLVGIGFGLQNTFNNFISGLILLFDGTIEVGDVVEVGGLTGRISKIGLRTTSITTREATEVIVPNSQFTEEKVLNWSHDIKPTRFCVGVGVAYGSDVEAVNRALMESVLENTTIMKTPSPFTRFLEFADSALLFEVHFWAKDSFGVEFVKSEVRFTIDKKFKEYGIKIPFPQRDLHIVSNPFVGGESFPPNRPN